MIEFCVILVYFVNISHEILIILRIFALYALENSFQFR